MYFNFIRLYLILFICIFISFICIYSISFDYTLISLICTITQWVRLHHTLLIYPWLSLRWVLKKYPRIFLKLILGVHNIFVLVYITYFSHLSFSKCFFWFISWLKMLSHFFWCLWKYCLLVQGLGGVCFLTEWKKPNISTFSIQPKNKYHLSMRNHDKPVGYYNWAS